MAPKNVPNGSAKEQPIEVSGSSQPAVVGINFGNSYASIAVLTNEGNAECIANEDGERQIACAISYHGEELYIGNQAKAQLVKNAHNTITGFRNLLGKKFSDLPKDEKPTSAAVIQHPTLPDTPAYTVQVTQAAPAPLPSSKSTPAASTTATPRSEPLETTLTLTPSEVTTIFLKSLIGSASDFLGKKIEGAVIGYPGWFEEGQVEALKDAAEKAGVKVLQLLVDAGAAGVTTTADNSTFGDLATNTSSPSADRTQLIVDLGSDSLSLTLLSIRQGLFYPLAESYHHGIGGTSIDTKLVKFLAKEFTKKTKTPLAVAPSTEKGDVRAEARLRLALEHTKRTISASPSAATCSVESLKDGMDFTGSVNRLRFDMEARSVYDFVYAKTEALLSEAGVEWIELDEVVYVGGSASLPGLDERLISPNGEGSAVGGYDPDRTVSPFTKGTIVGGGVGDPTTMISRGCAMQAKLIMQVLGKEGESSDVAKAFTDATTSQGEGAKWREVKTTSQSLGLLFPEEAGEGENGLGGQWVRVLAKETALPARRVVSVEVDLGAAEGEKKVGFEVWQVKEGVKTDHIKPPPLERDPEDEDDEEPEEEEDIEVKEKTVEKDEFLVALEIPAKFAKKQKGGWRTRVEVKLVVGVDGKVEIEACEVGKEGERGEIVKGETPAL
ncbi:actin-like ATPase domain-containing protein [Stereum hirsutum FP-91666 SS1]|uniref:actin-like ATPase domain-containing protein n=1 Tax=Stereum hirsutum (strain FP-91666) TaxID=721885 RepID=UPI000440E449|nr:actin-like ATPase domain-containing protein [Stereum hirsutum FP-91666 SS1]EIM91780.1 actin-like ATPase domain-containing protein [Stereum hirsutum FP-91666 SS1]